MGRSNSILHPPEARLRLWSDIALFSQAGMEMVWASLWYTGIFTREVRVPWWAVWLTFWGIIAVTYGMVRGMSYLAWGKRGRQALLLGWVVLSAFATLKFFVFPDRVTDLLYLLSAPIRTIAGADANGLPFLHLLIVPLVILRGVAIAQAMPDVRSALMDFQLGLAAILLYGILFIPLNPRISASGLFAYFFLGLLMMSAARISGVTNFRGGRLARLGKGWIAGVLGAAALVILASLLLGLLASSYAGEILARVVLAILALIGIVIVVILFPVFRLLANLILLALAQLRDLGNNEALRNLQKLLSQASSFANDLYIRILPVTAVFRILIPLAILLGVVLLVLLWLRLQDVKLDLRGEDNVATQPPGSLSDLLRRLAALGRSSGSRRMSPARLLAAARIRRVYAELMALCAGLGSPRKASATPLEFLPGAQAAIPGQDAALEQITQAYLKVRYGEYPESREEVDEVLGAWRQVKGAGRKLLAGRKDRG
jgi:hypothetical protein